MKITRQAILNHENYSSNNTQSMKITWRAILNPWKLPGKQNTFHENYPASNTQSMKITRQAILSSWKLLGKQYSLRENNSASNTHSTKLTRQEILTPRKLLGKKYSQSLHENYSVPWKLLDKQNPPHSRFRANNNHCMKITRQVKLTPW
jgi:hypothetical protein